MANNEDFLRSGKALNLDSAQKEAIRSELQTFISTGLVSLGRDERLQNSMDPQIDQFLHAARAETLAPEEKMLAKIRLREFVHNHPSRSGKRSLGFLSFSFHRLSAITASVALIAATGGGVSYAAEESLPGDTLYAFKRHVNEPVMIALAFDVKEKIEVHARITQRRLYEIEALVMRGYVSADEEMRTNLEYHLGAMQESITLLAEEEPDAATAENARIEAALEAHANVLSTLRTSSAPDIRPFLTKVTSAVSGAAKIAADTRVSFENSDEKASRISAEASLEQSERGIAEAKRSLDRMDGIADPRSLLRAKKALLEAEEELEHGKATLEAKAYREAFERSKKAHHRIEESRVITAGGEAEFSGDTDSESQSASSGTASFSAESSAEAESSTQEESSAENPLDPVLNVLP